MKKDKRFLSLVLAAVVTVTGVFSNVYALEDRNSNSNSPEPYNSKIYPNVSPINGLELTKDVRNADNFDVQNPEYVLNLTAKTTSNLVTRQVPCDIALILDTSNSMTGLMTGIKETNNDIVGKTIPNINGKYYIKTSDNQGYEEVTYWPGRNVWHSSTRGIVKYVMGGTGEYEYCNLPEGIQEWVANYEFYEKVTDTYGTEHYVPWIRYCIKIGDFVQKINGQYNSNGQYKPDDKSYNWYYFDSDSTLHEGIIPEKGATGKDNKYEFYELKEESQNKIDILKKEANQFIDDVASKSSNSTIDLISFDYGVQNQTNSFLTLSSKDNVNRIKNSINGLSTGSTTSTDWALKEALESMKKLPDSKDRKRIVILITDGIPTRYEESTDNIIQDALSYTDILKGPEVNSYVYSLGIFSNDELSNLQAQKFMKDAATPEDNLVTPSKKYFFNCMGTHNLNEVFTQITEETGLALTDCRIKDYIDPKFVITEASKKLLLSQGAEVTTEMIDGVTYEVVIWTKDIKPGTEGFKSSIAIKPKDSSVYGDNLPTNISGISAVYDSTGVNIGSFPLPHVNIVNLAQDLKQGKKSIKIKANDNSDRTYKITLTAWTNLQALEVKNNGVTDYGLSGIKNSTVKDYLDPRFEPTIEFLNSIAGKNDVKATKDASGNWCIEWINQFIPYRIGTDVNIQPWSKEIKVQAKAAFIGGNDIPTNISPTSGIYLGSRELLSFSLPRVNVPLNLKLNSKETTIFYGENIPTNGVEENMINLKIPDCFLGMGATGDITYKWSKVGESTSIGSIVDLGNIKPKDSGQYILTVNFQPKSNGTASSEGGGGSPVSTVKKSGIYTVNIVSGEIISTKKIKSNDIWFPHGDPIFTFKLEKLDEHDKVIETLYDVVRFQQEDGIYANEYASKSVKFQKLKKGKYRLSEMDTLRYKFEGNSIDTIKPCKGEVNGNSLIFYVGYEDKNNSSTNLNNNEGGGTFINKKVNDKYFSHTDVVKNTFTIKP